MAGLKDNTVILKKKDGGVGDFGKKWNFNSQKIPYFLLSSAMDFRRR